MARYICTMPILRSCCASMVLVLLACGQHEDRAAPPPVTAPAPVPVVVSDAAVADVPRTVDLAPDIAKLQALADQICACKDQRCASDPIHDHLVWEKELDLQRGSAAHEPYVHAVEADATLGALRARIRECAQRLH